MSRDPPENKKQKTDDFGINESEEVEEEEDVLNSENIEYLQRLLEDVRAPANLTTSNESAKLPPVSHGTGVERFHKMEPNRDSTGSTSPATHQATTSVEPPQSRSELEQDFLRIVQQIQGITTNNTLLEELRRLLPLVPRTHVNALRGQMLDWIERQRSNNFQNVPFLAPKFEHSERYRSFADQSTPTRDPTMHSHGVRNTKRGTYKKECRICGKRIATEKVLEKLKESRKEGSSIEQFLKNCCNCKVADDDPTVHSHGVRSTKRGTYKKECRICGKRIATEEVLEKLKESRKESSSIVQLLKNCCNCKVADDGGSGVFEGIKKTKFTYRQMENDEENIKTSIEKGLEFLRTLPLEDGSDSAESGKKREKYVCNMCGYPKLPKEQHEKNCILGPNEFLMMGKDNETVFIVEEISNGLNGIGREEGSNGGGEEKNGDSTMNSSDEEEDDRKQLPMRQDPDDNEDDDHSDRDNDGGARDGSSDEDSEGGTGFDEIKKYAV